MMHLPLGRAGRGLVFSSLLIVAACSSDSRPTAPYSRPQFAISDAAHAGAAPGFFFLPPIVPQPTLSGTFDADITTLDPRIAICDISTGPDVDCGGSGADATAAAIVFTTATSPAITVDSPTQYHVNWDTRGAGFMADHTYRVHVTAGASGARRELGFADVLLTDTPGQVKPLATGLSAMVSGTVNAAAAQQFYVANVVGGDNFTGSITVYAAGASDNVSPTNTITGANTGLNNPFGIARDAAGNLYVANNFGSSSITVYAPGAMGNASPVTTIAGPNTGLNRAVGIALGGGKLYVANSVGQSITVYAADASGDASPTATIAGSNTRLTDPQAVALDAAGEVYVVNAFVNRILIFA